jgi:hypothetical protein
MVPQRRQPELGYSHSLVLLFPILLEFCNLGRLLLVVFLFVIRVGCLPSFNLGVCRFDITRNDS